MGAYSFKLPDLGEGIVESEVTAWHVNVGDLVAEDDPLADVQTDKAVVEVTAPVAGRIAALGCEAGEVLAVGAELVGFELDGDTAEDCGSAAPAEADKAPAQAEAQPVGVTPMPASDPVFQQVLASPSLRKRARQEGVNLADVPGSGPKGRISHRDLESFLAAGGELAVRGSQLSTSTREVKLSGMRRVIARKMQQAKRNIPHYSYVEEVDVTELEALRVHLNDNRESHQPS